MNDHSYSNLSPLICRRKIISFHPVEGKFWPFFGFISLHDFVMLKNNIKTHP
ncbi:hypothetical protein JHK87_004154 [Glycine soja]|nr:hypothetical protein JHK87_004154 [Glycine soja]